jgi:hypothetical protein
MDHQKKVDDWTINWSDGSEEYFIFHFHVHPATEEKEEWTRWHVCQPTDRESTGYFCRYCNEHAPVGLVFFGKSRRLAD